MRAALALVLAGLLSACVGYRGDQRVVGRFEAPAREVLVIQPDGKIFFENHGKREFIGLVTIDKEAPLSIRVIAPDISPFIGTRITFSDDRRHLAVEWPTWHRATASITHPVEFHAK